MDSKYATLPWRAIISTAPGMVPLAMSSLSHCVIRSSRSAERPTSAGLASGRSCAGDIGGERQQQCKSKS